MPGPSPATHIKAAPRQRSGAAPEEQVMSATPAQSTESQLSVPSQLALALERRIFADFDAKYGGGGVTNMAQDTAYPPDALFKFLDEDGSSYHGGTGSWGLPSRHRDGTPRPGRWQTVSGPLVPCHNGLHVLRFKDLLQWIGPALFHVEVDGERVDLDDATEGKVVVRRARLVARVDTWNERTLRLFACDCAEHALLLTQARGIAIDHRSWNAIAVARRFASGEATADELAAARRAATAAARRVTRGGPGWDAARAAARAGAWDVAGAAAWAGAVAAAWAGAWDVARGAARGAARAAATDAERSWQTERLRSYLSGEMPGPVTFAGTEPRKA